MPIVAKCSCGKKYALNESMAGKKVKCKACGTILRIPKITPVPKQTTPAPKRTPVPKAVAAARAAVAAPAPAADDDDDFEEEAPAPAKPQRCENDGQVGNLKEKVV